MGKIFNTLGHFFAWLLNVGIPTAEKDVQQVAAIAGPVAAAFAQSVSGQGAAAQATVSAIAGCVMKAISDAGGVISANGLNVALDEQILPDVEELYKAVAGIFAPATPVAAAPVAGAK
ncbi:MAG: hypothetical protein ACRD1L_09715 [Terriglobales bacterium]